MEAPAESTEAKSLIALYSQAAQSNPYLQKVKALLQGDPSVELVDASTSKQVAELVQQRNRGLVIFSIRHKEDLTLVLNALAEWNPYIRSKFLRVIGVCQINHQQIPAMLMKRGCADLFSATLNDKALRHKINQSLKILETYHSQSGAAKPPPLASADPAAKASAALAAPTASAAEKAQGAIKKIPALKLASDCWLLRKERDIRQVQGRWIVDLIGPGPSAGVWGDNPKEPGVYEWKPKPTPESKDFITDEGAWVYKGRRPEFVWDIGRWRFLGEAPELFFRKGDDVLAARFKLAGDVMEVSENSPQAQAKLPMIIKSIENEVRFKRDEKKAQGSGKEIKEGKATAAGEGPEIKDSADDIASRILNYEEGEDGKAAENELNVHDLTKDKDPEYSDGFALKGEIDEVPFNQAPKPKLRITVQPAQTGAGRPVLVQPVELSDTDLKLEIPAGLFAVEDKVIVVMDDGLMTPKSLQKMDATVKQILASEGEFDTVAIHIDPALKISFAPIHSALKERQEEILNFLKAARGW